MDAELGIHWKRAAKIDKSLSCSGAVLKGLAKHKLPSQEYSRRRLFSAIARQEPILFHDFPLRSTLNPFFKDGVDSACRLRALFKAPTKTLTRAGPAKRARYLRIHKVIDIWERNRAILSANDVFFRISKLDQVFDCAAISDFNILPTAPPRINHLEVATLLMGTAGCMTDSHSDDPDGCNHCVEGKKLWLVWDRREGQARGLEDCEYDDVHTQARFSVKAFLQVQSAKWFLVSEGQTVFLPGNLTHKVITLERYLGISSFYVGLPNALSSLTRWKINGTIMVTDEYRNEIMKLLTKRLDQVVASNGQIKERWGFYHLKEALSFWEQRYPRSQREEMRSNSRFRELADKISLHSGQ